MDKQAAFAHYLGQDPATYAAAGPVTFERIYQDLEVKHGRKWARECGLSFLCAELRDYATAPAATPDGGTGDPKAEKMIARMLHELADQLQHIADGGGAARADANLAETR